MKIREVEWLKKNREKLDKDDIKALNEYDFFKQVDHGELDMPITEMAKLIKLTVKIHQKYIELEKGGLLCR